VEGAPGRHPVDHFDAADLDHPVALSGSSPVVSVSKTISRMVGTIGRAAASCKRARRVLHQLFDSLGGSIPAIRPYR
jgi:hypothetical protein